MIDAYASMRQYADHLTSIWCALAPELRGTFYGTPEVVAWITRPSYPFVCPAVVGFPNRRDPEPVLVASHTDLVAVRPRPVILQNHGAGQSYRADLGARGHESYAGGPDRADVVLHLEPGPLAAAAALVAGLPHVVTGPCKLDPWHSTERQLLQAMTEPVCLACPTTHMPPPWFRCPHRPPVIAIGFHHRPPQACPEQLPATPHYERALPAIVGGLRALGADVVGHGHPRGWERTANRWDAMGVEAEHDFFRVLDRADLYITDVSSTGMEFASTGRPVLWLNAPWHRRDAHHGGRFWDWLDHMLYVDGPDQLVEMCMYALANAPEVVERQWPAVVATYAPSAGRASQWAAEAIAGVLERY